MIRIVLTLIIFGCSTQASRASNEVRELEYVEQIESSYSSSSIGKIVWLKTKGKKFLTLYTETEKKENLGTAIIVHAMGGHPDQRQLINPLRTYLPQHNWATLSLQMPILSIGEKQDEYYFLFDDAYARIQAGIDYLVTSGEKNIVLIGDGLGGMMAAYYLKQNAEAEVKAIVAVSLSVPDTEHEQAQIIKFIRNIKQPFLDIYVEYDVSEVTDSARKRRMAGKKSSSYRQLIIEGEGHKRQHDEGLMVKRIYSWMNWVFR